MEAMKEEQNDFVGVIIMIIIALWIAMLFSSCSKDTCRCETVACYGDECTEFTVESEVEDEAECPTSSFTIDGVTTSCELVR